MKVSVSILKEYDRIINSVKKVNDSSADFLHIDVMDGVFVEDKKFNPGIVSDVKLISKKPIDLHLMVNDYEYIKEFVKLKPEYLTIHVEILKDKKIINYIKENDIKVGIAINPETNIEELLPYIDNIDLILFMSVTPGKGGQKFKYSVIEKIKELKKIVNDKVLISIDGGVNDQTVELCEYAGCDIVVSGSYITNSDNYDEKISKLKSN